MDSSSYRRDLPRASSGNRSGIFGNVPGPRLKAGRSTTMMPPVHTGWINFYRGLKIHQRKPVKQLRHGMTPPQDNLYALDHCEANILVMVRNKNILPGLHRGRLQFSAQTGACVQMRHNIGWDQNRNSRISWRFLEILGKIPEVIGDWHLISQLCRSNRCNPGRNFTFKKFLNICMYFIHI